MQLEYFTLPEAPGKPLFRCEKRRASLMSDRCASMWTEGNRKGCDDRFWLCKGCSIGAHHAGVGDSTLSPLFATSICARCHQGASRLVRGNYCPSCINRFYEKMKGRNARGNVPKSIPDFFPRRISYRAGGRVKSVRFEHSVDTTELMIAVLRDSEKQVFFGFRPPVPANLKQLRLF